MTGWAHVLAACPAVTDPGVQTWLSHVDATSQRHIAANPALDERVWSQLYSTRPLPPPKLAQLLVGPARALSEPQLQWVVEQDRRAAVLAHALQHQDQHWSVEQLTALALTSSSAQVAEHLVTRLASRGLHELIPPLLERCRASVRVEYLRQAASEIGAEQTAAHLSAAHLWLDAAVSAPVRAALVEVLDAAAPTIVTFATSAAATLREIAAGSRHLLGQRDLQVLLAAVPSDGRAHLYPSDQVAVHERQAFGKRTLFGPGLVLARLVSNPVVDLDLVRAVLDACAVDRTAATVRSACAQRLKASRVVTEPYEQVRDEATLAWLLSRAAGRALIWSDLHALLRNKNLTHAQAQYVVDRIADLTAGTLTSAQCASLAALSRRHPELDVPSGLRAHALSLRGASVAARPELPSAEKLLNQPVSAVRPGTDVAAAVAALVAAELGTQVGAWMFFVGFVDGFDGTFTELLEQARLLG